MRIVDLFCGCGGMGLGFQQAGFEIVYACDIDKYAIQSYRHNVGQHGVLADISKVSALEIPTAEVWTFGFPCQDLSVAGKQAGMGVGTRSGLFHEVMRLLDGVKEKPLVIMAENVKGLKPYLSVLEQEFAKRGYVMSYQLYNSKYWGVPQSRERYYVVGYRDYLKMPIEIREAIPKLSSVLEDEVHEKFFIDDAKAQKVIESARSKTNLFGVHATLTVDRAEKRQNGRRAKDNEEEMFTLTAQDNHGIIVTGLLDIKDKDQIRRVHDPKGIAPTATAVQGGHHHVKIVVDYDRNEGISRELDVAFTLNASDWRGLNRNQKQNAVLTDARVRRLTPREYARLQGFPDSYEIIVSDTQAYKQFGNSVTVPLVKAIAESIKAHLEGKL